MSGILVVEDDKILRKKITEILSSTFAGVVVLEASDGSECYEKLAGHSIDIVIMDIRLKTENGLGIVKKIKRRTPDLFVIIHSMYDAPEYIRTADDCGADAFLSKRENSIGDLIDVIRSVFGNALQNPCH